MQDRFPFKVNRPQRLCDHCDIGVFPDAHLNLCLLPAGTAECW